MPDLTVSLHVTALYAGILGLMSLVLAMAAGQQRGKAGVSVGDGGNPELVLAMRRHANFLEYVPMLLILFGALEINGVSPTALHVMGASLVVARICHAVGLESDTIQNAGRMVGALGTMLLSLVASIWAIATFF